MVELEDVAYVESAPLGELCAGELSDVMAADDDFS